MKKISHAQKINMLSRYVDLIYSFYSNNTIQLMSCNLPTRDSNPNFLLIIQWNHGIKRFFDFKWSNAIERYSIRYTFKDFTNKNSVIINDDQAIEIINKYLTDFTNPDAINDEILNSLNAHLTSYTGIENIDNWNYDIEPPYGIKILFDSTKDSILPSKIGFTGSFDSSGRCPGDGGLIYVKDEDRYIRTFGIYRWKAVPFEVKDFWNDRLLSY